ncbi:MAG TPA: type II secretion system protein [Chthoniobacterales bacterium]|nr:type II secretion system protein [Chthoniobacterales bacterium]
MMARSQVTNLRHPEAFTLLELLIVMTIIIILAGITFATMGYVNNKARRSRAEAEIAAISAALENYKADNGTYPSTTNTVSLTATGPVDNDSKTGTYAKATLDLYELITGDTAHDGSLPTGAKSYMQFKPTMLGPEGRKAPPTASNKVTSIMDPFGHSYGYSTAKNPDVNPTGAASASGYNPTFDLWSVANADPNTDQKQWIKNW